MINRTVTFAKQNTPESWRIAARRAQLEAHNVRLRLAVPVTTRTEFANIYHCAIRKTASQWITALFGDPLVYRYSGLLPYVPRYYKWQHPEPPPRHRIALSMFLSHHKFETIPKPDPWRAFFIYRDPRDMVVSSYFSTLKTHGPMGDIPQLRRELSARPVKDGLIHLIGHHNRKGTFRALRSWVTAAQDERIALFRYEDLTGARQAGELDRLLRHCGITIPPDDLATLRERYSFARMRGNQPISHYRKGTAGDWQNHFDDDINRAFTTATGNLIELLGYPARPQVPSPRPGGH
ncbi:sulfotransferase domain-containing protein [Actinoplanes sp. NPDC049265]|uniref:sulfotransferase domain-containing protein n=1 Tax=Actinoplanes sp. NPDC049265 TaxID=3363902 RepID=UPI00371B2D8B